MRITIALILLSLSADGVGFAADSTFEKFTGHDWKKYNQTMKAFYMTGFLEGNTLGRFQETESDAAMALKWAMDRLCDDKKQKAACDGVTMLFADKLQDLKQLVDDKEPIRLHKPLGYFVSELDAFYEAFPLCRGRSLALTLAQLVNIWAGGKSTYEKVGANCGK